MSATIAAEPRRVWQAITVPSQCIAWDDQLLALIDPAAKYPTAGEDVRWRFLLRSVQMILDECPIEVVPLRKLRSRLTVGSFRFDQTFTLAAEAEGSPDAGAKTRLGMKIIASNSVPVMGAVVDRFEVRRMTVDRVDSVLRAITKWCENSA
jgi:hypothetical protein